MKSDYNGLVEQSEMNQSVDENFNSLVPPHATTMTPRPRIVLTHLIPPHRTTTVPRPHLAFTHWHLA
jgi:hypothetical protein